MAFNFKSFLTRLLSSIVFSFLLLGSLLWNYYSFTAFFFIVAMLGLNEFYNLAEKLQARPFRAVGYFVGAITYFSFMNACFFFGEGENFFTPFMAGLPFVIFIVSIFSRRERPFQNALYTLAGVIYAVLPFALIHELVFTFNLQSNDPVYYPEIFLGIILLIWSNDTFAYLGGSLFGKHKLVERISPGKTWEGTIIGIITTTGMAFVIQKFLFDSGFNFFILLGIIVPVLATAGDLLESLLKREAGIKDTGNIMPGHGGVLDRFDSLIFVSPFLYVLMKLGPLIFGF